MGKNTWKYFVVSLKQGANYVLRSPHFGAMIVNSKKITKLFIILFHCYNLPMEIILYLIFKTEHK